MHLLKLSKTQASRYEPCYMVRMAKEQRTVNGMERKTNISTLKDHSSLGYQMHSESLEYLPDAE